MGPETVYDKDSFLRFLDAMRGELSAGAGNWENIDLASFLEAMAAWVDDWDSPARDNQWRHAAELLRSGASYE
ncbi:hypothetical protein EDC40_101292 [Aminobacter aminovorans]|uniref:DUF7660 domain-containing protein n=1 Tax=Aminobacter aminovorans TaxID=83263 RepID=A0A380WRR0_AMIAI|nr:hypothetical protein [Aminobacter aminovorans]TCS29975.1 hypothetical protein EDC40_101292 [Aminobacter aminovorans]SUU90824.1 Uncharacterised protein [Aminobacter aminovorans]